MPKFLMESFDVTDDQVVPSQARAKCGVEDPVFGEMVSMIRYPMKMTWFSENDDVVLHDLSWDADEALNQMERQPERAAALRVELETFVRGHLLGREPSAAPEISEEAARRLEALGYIH